MPRSQQVFRHMVRAQGSAQAAPRLVPSLRAPQLLSVLQWRQGVLSQETLQVSAASSQTLGGGGGGDDGNGDGSGGEGDGGSGDGDSSGGDGDGIGGDGDGSGGHVREGVEPAGGEGEAGSSTSEGDVELSIAAFGAAARGSG